MHSEIFGVFGEMSIQGRLFNCVEVLLITGHEGPEGEV